MVTTEPSDARAATARPSNALGHVIQRRAYAVNAHFGNSVLLRFYIWRSAQTSQQQLQQIACLLNHREIMEHVVKDASETQRFAFGHIALAAPTLGPAASPEPGPPPLDLDGAITDAGWKTAGVSCFAHWTRSAIQEFEHLHDEMWARVRCGQANSTELREHLRKIPKPLAKSHSLQVLPNHKSQAPVNAQALCEHIDLMICEAKAFWEMQV